MNVSGPGIGRPAHGPAERYRVCVVALGSGSHVRSTGVAYAADVRTSAADAAAGRSSVAASAATETSRRVRMSDTQRGRGSAERRSRSRGRGARRRRRRCRAGRRRPRARARAAGRRRHRRRSRSPADAAAALGALAGRHGADGLGDGAGEQVDGVRLPGRLQLGAEHGLGVRLRGGEQLELVTRAPRRGGLAGLGLLTGASRCRALRGRRARSGRRGGV